MPVVSPVREGWQRADNRQSASRDHIAVAMILGRCTVLPSNDYSSRAQSAHCGAGEPVSRINQRIIEPPGISGSATSRITTILAVTAAVRRGAIEFVPVGPVIHEQDGTTHQYVRATVNNRVIITTKRGR